MAARGLAGAGAAGEYQILRGGPGDLEPPSGGPVARSTVISGASYPATISKPGTATRPPVSRTEAGSKDLQLRGLLALVTVGAARYAGSMRYCRWRRADWRRAGPPPAGAAGRCRADRGGHQRPGADPAVPGVADAGEPAAAGAGHARQQRHPAGPPRGQARDRPWGPSTPSRRRDHAGPYRRPDITGMSASPNARWSGRPRGPRRACRNRRL